MIRYWRVWLLIIMVIGSLLAIGLKSFPYGREGVEIVYLDPTSPAQGILEQGMIITDINRQQIKNLDDWNRLSHETGEVAIRANGQVYTLQVNESLGINAVAIERTNLELGLDLQGGTRIILQPEGNTSKDIIDQTIEILETRANLFGLQEVKFSPVQDLEGGQLIQVEAAGVGSDVVDELLSRQGKFVAKVVKPVDLVNGSGTLIIGSDEFPVTVSGNTSIVVDGGEIETGESFEMNNIPFEYINRSGNRVLLHATVFDGEDIELVYTDPQRSGVLPQGDAYQFFFQVLLSVDGAGTFADVTTGIPTFFDVNTGQQYLESSLLLFIDDRLVSSLNIAGSLGGQIIQSPQITGSEITLEAANQEKLRLQTILQSGALPVALTTVSIGVVSPTLGAGFFEAAAMAGLIGVTMVFVILFARYRRIRITVPLILIGLSEAIIILGIAATNDYAVWSVVLVANLAVVIFAWLKKQEIDLYAWFGALLIPIIGMLSWTIDLPAIAGLLAVIGTGVDHQIIIADEALKKKRKIYGVSEHLRRAFFIIVGAAGTTIFAMLPLLFVGVGLIRGFAITTIAGVLVGILVTRPAFARIVEHASEDHGTESHHENKQPA